MRGDSSVCCSFPVGVCVQIQFTLNWMNARGEVFPFDGRGLTLARGTPSEGVKLGMCFVESCSPIGGFFVHLLELYNKPALARFIKQKYADFGLHELYGNKMNSCCPIIRYYAAPRKVYFKLAC